ncbi:hypothetical protein GCM10023229_23760 [Flavisolibacter ginsenosidimutans]
MPEYSVSVKELLMNVSLVGTVSVWFNGKLVSGVYWTLLVEIQFYFMIYLLIYFKKLTYIRTFLIAWLACSLLINLGQSYFTHNALLHKLSLAFVAEYSYYFIAGCYFYLIKYDRKKGDLVMPLLCMFVAVTCSKLHLYNTAFDLAGSVIIAVFFGVFYFISLRDIRYSSNFQFIEKMGNITYPLYLIHETLGLILIGKWKNYMPAPLLMCVTAILMISIAYLSYLYIEKPVMKKLKDLLFAQRRWQAEKQEPLQAMIVEQISTQHGERQLN